MQGIELNRRSRNPAGVLSIRESEVVRLYASGLTVNEIAERLQQAGVDATCSLNDNKRFFQDTYISH